jgi:ferredoxin-type protein NapH
MKLKKGLKVLKRHKWRYLSIFAGFFLFVAPFAFITRGVYWLMGSDLTASVHTVCFRMPLIWLSKSCPFLVDYWTASFFFIMVVAVAFVASPLWCGWLCPIGGISEGLSRIVPIPDRFKLYIKNTRVTVGLRYGFLAGFLLVAFLIGLRSVEYQFGGVTARYCPEYITQSVSYALFGGGPFIDPLNSGIILTLIAWVVIGGLFFVGGRGWCLFFCPLGAASGLACKIGNAAGTMGIQFNSHQCRDCKRCQTKCPMWAIREDGTIEKALCIGCEECVKSCTFKAYRYGRMKRKVREGERKTE